MREFFDLFSPVRIARVVGTIRLIGSEMTANSISPESKNQ